MTVISRGSTRCNVCGRFFSQSAPGGSWSRSYTHYDLHDPVYRCPPCTTAKGIPATNCNPDTGPWNGYLTPPAPLNMKGDEG